MQQSSSSSLHPCHPHPPPTHPTPDPPLPAGGHAAVLDRPPHWADRHGCHPDRCGLPAPARGGGGLGFQEVSGVSRVWGFQGLGLRPSSVRSARQLAPSGDSATLLCVVVCVGAHPGVGADPSGWGYPSTPSTCLHRAQSTECWGGGPGRHACLAASPRAHPPIPTSPPPPLLHTTLCTLCRRLCRRSHDASAVGPRASHPARAAAGGAGGGEHAAGRRRGRRQRPGQRARDW